MFHATIAIPVDTRDKNPARFYHLDCGMARLPKGEYLVSESLTNPATLSTLKNFLGNDLIVVKDLIKEPGGERALLKEDSAKRSRMPVRKTKRLVEA